MYPFCCVAFAVGDGINLRHVHIDCYNKIALIKDVERLHKDWSDDFERYYVGIKIEGT